MSAAYPTLTQAAAGRAGAPRRGYQMPTVRELPRRWDPLADHEIVVHPPGTAAVRLRRPTMTSQTA
jgi:hypothetical protein